MLEIRRGTLINVLDHAHGVNNPVRGVVEMGGERVVAYVKEVPKREILIECICALLARNLDLNAPEPLIVLYPSRLRHDRGDELGFGSVSVGNDNLGAWTARLSDRRVQERLRAWADLVPAACFDEWIGNPDRHSGNILFDGQSTFWLIDHGHAVAQFLLPDQAASANDLFAKSVRGLAERDLLALRSMAMNVLDKYKGHHVNPLMTPLPSEVCDFGIQRGVEQWLEERQDHLLRLGDARIPAQQGNLLIGGRDG